MSVSVERKGEQEEEEEEEGITTESDASWGLMLVSVEGEEEGGETKEGMVEKE